MFICFCLRSITIFTLKIKLNFLSKICHFLKKNSSLKAVKNEEIVRERNFTDD
jgi:hypothetical protein